MVCAGGGGPGIPGACAAVGTGVWAEGGSAGCGKQGGYESSAGYGKQGGYENLGERESSEEHMV